MKLWVPTRALSRRPNSDRPLSSHTLHLRHRHRLLLCCPHLPLVLCNPPPFNYNNSFRRLRPPLRTNIILRRHCHYKSSFRSPLYRQFSSPMNLRRILRRQCHPHSFFCLSLPPPLHYCSCNHSAPYFFTRNRI
uniref:Uncharacterized protein n=1 Tax=Neolamprologus brichardi TaxID=32507 RepID=A0A3Q4GAW5_NEOBR